MSVSTPTGSQSSTLHQDVVAGRRDQLAGMIQQRYGVAKDEAERQLTEWQRKASDHWFAPKVDKDA